MCKRSTHCAHSHTIPMDLKENIADEVCRLKADIKEMIQNDTEIKQKLKDQVI